MTKYHTVEGGEIIVGEQYVTRGGDVVTVKAICDHHTYPIGGVNGTSWTSDGYTHNQRQPCPGDLMRRYKPGKRQIKAGDLVTVRIDECDADELNEYGHTAIGREQITSIQPAPEPKVEVIYLARDGEGDSVLAEHAGDMPEGWEHKYKLTFTDGKPSIEQIGGGCE